MVKYLKYSAALRIQREVLKVKDSKDHDSQNIADAKRLNELTRELMELSGSFLNDIFKLQDMSDAFPKIDMLDPDPYGCERMFVKHFVSMELGTEFRPIAKEFFIHEYPHLEECEQTDYLNLQANPVWPELMFNQYTVQLMVNATNAGSEYSKALILYLYKKYYYQEYKSLKRFKSLSLSELLSLAEPDFESYSFSYDVNTARILYIANLMGIEIGEDCNAVYAYLNDRAKRSEEAAQLDSAPALGNVIDDCREVVSEKYESQRMYNVDRKITKFMDSVLEWYGVMPGYVDLCDGMEMTTAERMAVTLALLRRDHPNKEYSLTELLLYTEIHHCIGALVNVADWIIETLDALGLEAIQNDAIDEVREWFKPEEIRGNTAANTKNKQSASVQMSVKPSHIEGKEDIEAVMQEVQQLRRKVHMLETDKEDLRAQLNDKRRLEENNKAMSMQMDAVNRELVSLRAYVYSLTEEDAPAVNESIPQMKAAIADRRIVIVGGHPNWVSKMKREFPGWTFVNPDAGASTDASIVEKADFVFFFTDIISHSRYHQFMNVIRERNVDFSYIHGVNIERNIQDIYREVMEEE